MRRILLPLATLLALPLAAHATPIDDFTLTSTHHTFTWSLPALIPNYNPFPNQTPSINFWTATTSITEDGTSTSTETITFYKSISPMSGLQFENYVLYGPAVSVPNPTDPTVATYNTSTFSFRDAPNNGSRPNQVLDGPYTLTITPETPASVTPEPGTLTLLATGALGLLSAVRRRTSL